MANSYIQHYSGQYIEICFLFQHILQLHSNSQIHTFQCPITKIHLETQILITSNKKSIHNLTCNATEKNKIEVFPILKSHTSRSNNSSSAFQSVHISGKDRLSYTKKEKA